MCIVVLILDTVDGARNAVVLQSSGVMVDRPREAKSQVKEQVHR